MGVDLAFSRNVGGSARVLEKRLQAGLRAPEDRRMHVMRAFIGVDRLEVLRVTHHMIAAGDAIGAVDVAGEPRNVEGLARIVAFDDGDHFRRQLALVHQAPDPQRGLQPQRDFGLHVGEVLLDELGRRKRAANRLRSKAYSRERRQRSSAAPSAPQEMPYRARLRQPNGPLRPETLGSI